MANFHPSSFTFVDCENYCTRWYSTWAGVLPSDLILINFVGYLFKFVIGKNNEIHCNARWKTFIEDMIEQWISKRENKKKKGKTRSDAIAQHLSHSVLIQPVQGCRLLSLYFLTFFIASLILRHVIFDRCSPPVFRLNFTHLFATLMSNIIMVNSEDNSFSIIIHQFNHMTRSFCGSIKWFVCERYPTTKWNPSD